MMAYFDLECKTPNILLASVPVVPSATAFLCLPIRQSMAPPTSSTWSQRIGRCAKRFQSVLKSMVNTRGQVAFEQRYRNPACAIRLAAPVVRAWFFLVVVVVLVLVCVFVCLIFAHSCLFWTRSNESTCPGIAVHRFPHSKPQPASRTCNYTVYI